MIKLQQATTELRVTRETEEINNVLTKDNVLISLLRSDDPWDYSSITLQFECLDELIRKLEEVKQHTTKTTKITTT
jgi:hypothetical protein